MASQPTLSEEQPSLRHELPEGVGRKPIYTELGEYGQFVFEPDILPSFYRVESGDDLCHFIFDSGHYQGKTSAYEPLQRKMFQTLCSDYVSPYKKLQRLFYIGMAKFYGNIAAIITLTILFSLVYFSLEYLNLESIWVFIGIAIMGVPTTFLLWFFNLRNYVLADSHSLYTNWQAEENPDPNTNTCQNANTIDVIDWFNSVSGNHIPLNQDHKEKIGAAVSFFSKSQRGFGVSTIYPFKGLSQPSLRELDEEDRYLLAQLRTEKLWSESNKVINQYCDWLGWDNSEKRNAKSQDLYLIAGWLKEELIKKYTRDIEKGLERLIGNKTERRAYFQRMHDETLFWLERPVESENNKQPFLQWIKKEIEQWDGEILYLTSEAAMGKSTTINLFGLAGCEDKLSSNIIPIRIKIRELEYDIQKSRNKTDEDFIRLILNTINVESVGKTNYAIRHYLDSQYNSQPLLILDGMDEIKRGNQQILLDRLSNLVDLEFPIIVTSRPSNLVSPESVPSGRHAQLCHLSPEQRMKILQNLEMSAQALESMQDYLSPELIDRPFALMIAAKTLRKSEELEGVMGTRNDLSISKICQEYLQQFNYREDTKRTSDDDDNSLRRNSKTALEAIASHQVGVMCGNIDEGVFPIIDIEIEKYLLKRSQINNNLILIDTWLEGYYAASSQFFEASNWGDILRYGDEPGRRSLILRNYCCNAPVKKTPNWNELGDYAPEIMHIASEEWLTMNIEKRQKLLNRFGIPTDENGHIDFTDENDELLNQCTISELLAIIHFHCSIMDVEKWKKGFVDQQWEKMFKIFLNRIDQYVSKEQKILIKVQKPTSKEKKTSHQLVSEILSENVAKYVKKLIPFEGKTAESSFSSVYSGNDNPISLFNVIANEIKINHDDSNICTAVYLIPLFANNTLFRIDAEVMLKHFDEDYSGVSGKYIDMFCKLVGITRKQNMELAREIGWLTFAKSLGLISRKKYFSNINIDFQPSNPSNWTISAQKNYEKISVKASVHKDRIIYFYPKSYQFTESHEKIMNLPLSLITSISYYKSVIDKISLRYGMLTSNGGKSKKFAAPDNWQKLFKGTNKCIPNTKLSSIITEFEQTQAKKFQTISFYEELQIQLDGIAENHGKVIGYLFHGEKLSWGRSHRWMYLPGLEDTRLGGLAFEKDSESAEKFNKFKFHPSNKWYTFDMQIRQDDGGYWNFEPKPSSLRILCQLCLQKTLDSVKSRLLCKECDKIVSVQDFLRKEFHRVYDEFGTDHAGWNTVIHDIRVDFNSRIATVFAPEKDHRKYFLGDKKGHKDWEQKKVRTPYNWIIRKVEKSVIKKFRIKKIYVQPIESQVDKNQEEE